MEVVLSTVEQGRGPVQKVEEFLLEPPSGKPGGQGRAEPAAWSARPPPSAELLLEPAFLPRGEEAEPTPEETWL